VKARDLLSEHALQVAPLLLNSVLVSDVGGVRVALRITEVEAYGGVGEDPGSHAFRRQTPRNASMFLGPGRLYCYFTYGMHWCANVVTRPAGQAGAVLLRAGEIVRGLDMARARRGSAVRDRELARGPARLAVALGLNGDADGLDLLGRSSPVRLKLPDPVDSATVAVTTRTGVSGAGAMAQWRFYIRDEASVSPHRPVRVPPGAPAAP
jgi:DNA-3-methyladenine glycosylase